MINQDTTRAEKLSISIEETESEISNLQMVIQEVSNIKDKLFDYGFSDEFNKIIENSESQITYLEGLKESDENILNELNCGLNKK